jgi:SNF2 family DNA or RNA helicase
MLDLIQPALRKHHIPFHRIDGQTSLEARRETLRRFNSDHEFTVMLASIGSCGEGYDYIPLRPSASQTGTAG